MFRRTDDLAGLLVVQLLVPVEQAEHGEGGGEDQADPQGHVPREARKVNPLWDTWKSFTFTSTGLHDYYGKIVRHRNTLIKYQNAMEQSAVCLTAD